MRQRIAPPRPPGRVTLALFAALAVVGILVLCGLAMAGPGPVLGGALPGPLPLFPADNWWNTDVSGAPVDPSSASFITYINNGGTRRLHPDLGGEVSPGSAEIYGMPYVVVDGTQPKVTVHFRAYGGESDGVNVPFYPIPPQAATSPHWVEGGAPGTEDLRSEQDRHLIIVDRDNKLLYELYGVWFNAGTQQWEADSGAFWDMKTNNRRPEGWTSADAAGLAILPGLLRWDEVFDPTVTEIRHALRVTVRQTNGYVYPASHRAGSTVGALPMGARLRLKASTDISGFSPEMQKVFRAMKRYGLIVADNGSDMYIGGTFDPRWNNDVVNPAFAALTASDFEVVQLGWKPGTAAPPVTVASYGVSPGTVTGGASSTGTVALSGAAPAGGAVVALSSANPAVVSVPASVTVPGGESAASFTITTTAPQATTVVSLTATTGSTSRTAALTVNPPATPPPPPPTPALTSVTFPNESIVRGNSMTGTVRIAAAAPAGGVVVTLTSSNTRAATVPASVTIPAGSTSTTFTLQVPASAPKATVTISATAGTVTKTVKVYVKRF
jgi:hypothetical protein